MNTGFWLFAVLGAGVWFALVGQVGVRECIYGAIVVLSAWGILTRLSELELVLPPHHALSWLKGVGGYLLGYVSMDMVRSTFRVFRKVLSPRIEIAPAILAVPVPDAPRAALILLAYGIALTPGQQIVAIDEANSTLYVHFLDAPDPEAAREAVQDLYCRYLKEATQW
ncbi:Na(+)/H(+) antiporter subunit E [compost metagenome]